MITPKMSILAHYWPCLFLGSSPVACHPWACCPANVFLTTVPSICWITTHSGHSSMADTYVKNTVWISSQNFFVRQDLKLIFSSYAGRSLLQWWGRRPVNCGDLPAQHRPLQPCTKTVPSWATNWKRVFTWSQEFTVPPCISHGIALEDLNFGME